MVQEQVLQARLRDVQVVEFAARLPSRLKLRGLVQKYLLKEAGVIEEVRKLLGSDVVAEAGVLDKKAVAAKIFHDPGLNKGLEGIIHPLVFERVNDFIGRIKDKNRVVIVEVPLLFEGNYQKDFSKVITVYASEEAAIERLENSGVTREEALLRLRSQLPIEEKKAHADYVIDNGGSKEDTRRQVEEVYGLLCEETKKA